MLLRVRLRRVRLAVVAHHEVRGHGDAARGGMDDMAEIAENVMVRVGDNGRVELQAIPGQEVRNPGWMHAQLHDHGRRLRAIVGNPVTRVNLHRYPRRSITGPTLSFA